MRQIESSDKTIILLPPDTEITKFFRNERKCKKITWRKSNKYDNVIALSDWDKILILRIIFLIPLIVIIILTFLLFLLIFGPYYFFNKKKANSYFEKYMKSLSYFLKQKDSYEYHTAQYLVDQWYNNKEEKDIYRVLYLHESELKILSYFDKGKFRNFIDSIWVYNHTAELFERIIKEKYSNPKSKIIDFENIINHTVWIKKNDNEFSSLNFEWVGNKNLHQILFRVSSIKSSNGDIYRPRITSPRIKLLPNNLLDNTIVFYFETKKHEHINRYLLDNYIQINNRLSKKGMKLLYFPGTHDRQNAIVTEELLSYLNYKYPFLFSKETSVAKTTWQQIIKQTDFTNFYGEMGKVLGIPDSSYPCFLHAVDKEVDLNPQRQFLYSIHEFTSDDENILAREINHYVDLVAIPKNQVYFSLATSDPDDPDNAFDKEGNKINDNLKAIITQFEEANNEKLFIDSLLFLFSKLNNTHPQVCSKLNQVLSNKISKGDNKLSKLFIDEHYRLFLVDYDNLEIILTPLQKTLYLFFLEKEDGVKLKDLCNYKKRLIDIYAKVGNRSDMELIRKSIHDLTDATSNSVNEKCSRIKESFISNMHDSIARHYYITGSRSENKKIILDRSMVIFSETK